MSSSGKAVKYKAALLIALVIHARPSTTKDIPQRDVVPQHDVTVINISVPTRVFDGDRFVDNLRAEDFEVSENGVPQKVEAAYLIKKTSILQNTQVPGSAATVALPVEMPDESLQRRSFVLIFEMDEYLPRLSEAIDMFMADVLSPDDALQIITPEDSWAVKVGVPTKESRAKLADEIKGRLRKALTLSGSQLKRLLMDLRIEAQGSTDGEDSQGNSVMTAATIIDQIISSKAMNIRDYGSVAKWLKSLPGQKIVFLFYQRESYVIPAVFKPLYEKREARNENIDRGAIYRLFSDADATVQFVYLTKTSGNISDVEWRNSGEAAPIAMSGDFYTAFRNLADATGGISEATANPIYGFKKAVEASESYYVIYYRPAEYKADGKYKEIEVKVKGGKFKVIHRAGYIDKS